MSNRLTIILALKDRVPFALRWMRFANKERFSFKIILADGGADNTAREIFANKSNFPNLIYEYIRYPADINYTTYYKKISDAIALVDTPYLLMADDDDFSARFGHGLVHLALRIGKNPQFRDLAAEPDDILCRVGLLDAEKDEQPAADSGNNPAFDFHRGFGHPLDHRPHGCSLVGFIVITRWSFMMEK